MLSQSSLLPCFCTSARALPGLVSRCNTLLAWAYKTGSLRTCSKAGKRMTALLRSSVLRRILWSLLSSDFFLNVIGLLVSDLAATMPLVSFSVLSELALLPPDSVVSYGLICLSTLPGVSILLESMIFKSSGSVLLIKAVPRTSVISLTDSPAATR